MKEYSLVIQGPILSIGRTGKTHIGYKNKEASKQLIVNYNCIENIQQLLRTYAHLFKEIVIVTWVDELIEESDIAFCENCRLVKIEDITPSFKSSFHPTGQINLLKQFLSFKKGIEELSTDHKEHYVVKVRTDQFLDLEALLKAHKESLEEEKAHKIYVPYFSNYEIADFYFVGRKNILLDFCNAVMDLPSYPQFNIVGFSVHLIMPLLYWLSKERESYADILNVFFLKAYTDLIKIGDKEIPNSQLLYRFVDKLDQYFTALPLEVYTSIIWRGDQMITGGSSRHKVYKENKKEVGPPLNAYNFFIYCSLMRYLKNKGTINLRAILGLLNWLLMTLFPFYKKRIIANIEQYSKE